MTKSMQEYIEASSEILGEIQDLEVTAAQIKKVVDREYADWSDQERDDLLLLAAHVAAAEGWAIREAVARHESAAFATASALRKFIGRDVEKRARSKRKAIIDEYLRPKD